jgi:hypothetical protein
VDPKRLGRKPIVSEFNFEIVELGLGDGSGERYHIAVQERTLVIYKPAD